MLCFIPVVFCAVILTGSAALENPAGHPHVIFILADDLGWNDASFHGSDQIPTPNIDALAYSGVILNRHYTQPVCTPSRASLMTGKYSVHYGIHGALLPTHNAGLPLSEKIMPQYFKELGYSTHLVGKWHLGFYKKEFTPLQRGFDTHYGYWAGGISYYDHICENPFPTLNLSGHDMRRDYTPDYDVIGEYATDLLTKEAVSLIEKHDPERPMFMMLAHLAPHAGNQGKWLEAPQEEINKFSYISNPNRRSYAAMVSKLDQSVGDVVAALENQGMLKNSIIVFVSDNGAPNIGVYQNWGSNYPFRGQKATLWEGAVRTPSLIWSPMISRQSRVFTELMHITDWLPTLLAAAGQKGCTLNIDGVNQWEAISLGYPGIREHLVIDIEDETSMAAIIFNDFKYVKGPVPPIYKHVQREVSMFLNTDTIISPKQPTYNTENITATPVWKTLQKYSRHPFSPFFISDLRRQATITCYHNHGKEVDCTDKPCLFRIVDDPCEQHNVADKFPEIVDTIEMTINVYKKGAVTVLMDEDPASNPENFNGDWDIWVA